MISCIICSRKSDVSFDLRDNIATTIGCAYELITIDNSQNDYSMFSAYNEGVRRANGDILCFMHEDVLYHTQNWGLNVEKRFCNDNSLGLIGVLGSHYLANCVCNVGDSGLLSSNYYTKDKEKYYYRDKYFDETGATEVVCVDGMWFCIRKSLFNNKIEFDETFPGFHYYDMDICLQIVKNNYKVEVVNDVLVEHFSQGDIDACFIKNSFKFYEKWKEYLPLVKGYEFSEVELRLSTELSAITAWAREMHFYQKKLHNKWWYKFMKKIRSLLK